MGGAVNTGAKVVLSFAAVAASALSTGAFVLSSRRREAVTLSPVAPADGGPYAGEKEAAAAAVASCNSAASGAEGALRDGKPVQALQNFRDACEFYGRAVGRSVHVPTADQPQLGPLLSRLWNIQKSLNTALGDGP
jgi:hypothetical protein